MEIKRALEAAAHGLALEPGDDEFLTLKREIEHGAPLEQMEYHWINPDADQMLQQGLDADADDKQRAISCMTVSEEGLDRFWSIFGPKPEQYTPNAPYTQFPYTGNDCRVDLVFQMNEAGMSKLAPDWLEQLKGWLQSGQWLERAHPDGRAARLDTVLVGLDYRMGLLYKLSEEDVYFQIFRNPDGTDRRALSGLPRRAVNRNFTQKKRCLRSNSISRGPLGSLTMCSTRWFPLISM